MTDAQQGTYESKMNTCPLSVHLDLARRHRSSRLDANIACVFPTGSESRRQRQERGSMKHRVDRSHPSLRGGSLQARCDTVPFKRKHFHAKFVTNRGGATAHIVTFWPERLVTGKEIGNELGQLRQEQFSKDDRQQEGERWLRTCWILRRCQVLRRLGIGRKGRRREKGLKEVHRASAVDQDMVDGWNSASAVAGQ